MGRKSLTSKAGYNSYSNEIKLTAVGMYQRGIGVADIMRILGIESRATIRSWLNDPDIHKLPVGQKSMEALGETLGSRALNLASHILGSISDEDIEKASLRDKATSFGLLVDKYTALKGLGGGGEGDIASRLLDSIARVGKMYNESRPVVEEVVVEGEVTDG